MFFLSMPVQFLLTYEWGINNQGIDAENKGDSPVQALMLKDVHFRYSDIIISPKYQEKSTGATISDFEQRSMNLQRT